MKRLVQLSCSAALTAWMPFGLATAAFAAGFDSGSNGSYGPINVTAPTTLDVPPDGIFHCTTITVTSTLRFNRNALNTPVYLLATGDVLINGTINVSGGTGGGASARSGGPGGFDGGFGGFGDSAPANRGGDGHGPGRGRNQAGFTHAAYSKAAASNSEVYGNVLIVPLIGGSGGAGADGNPGGGGGGGGGAILIASNTRITVNGNIISDGGGGTGWGSGGSIRLVAPTGSGGGGLYARSLSLGGLGSDGRIRIDTEDRLAFRNLVLGGASTRGTRMFVFPPVTPKLHIVEAAGQVIPVGSASGVNIELPAGTSTSQTVRLRGEGFTGTVAVRLVVTPEHSASSVFDLTLDAGASPPEVSTTVTLPVGEPTRIDAWAK